MIMNSTLQRSSPNATTVLYGRSLPCLIAGESSLFRVMPTMDIDILDLKVPHQGKSQERRAHWASSFAAANLIL